MAIFPERSCGGTSDSRQSKEGSTYSIGLDPIGFCVPVGNTKSCYLLCDRL